MHSIMLAEVHAPIGYVRWWMRTIGLLGVPTNSAGTIGGVARAPTTLREVGLVEALRQHADVHDYGDVMLPDPSPERDPITHLIDHHGLIAMVTRVRDAVTSILGNGHFPLVIGGDCPLLLGCLAGAKTNERIGLLFVDGHEDAYLPAQSSTGEAADSALAFALGMADASWRPSLPPCCRSSGLPMSESSVRATPDSCVPRASPRSAIASRSWTETASPPNPTSRPPRRFRFSPTRGGSTSTSTSCRRGRSRRSTTRSPAASDGTSSRSSERRQWVRTQRGGTSRSTTRSWIPNGSMPSVSFASSAPRSPWTIRGRALGRKKRTSDPRIMSLVVTTFLPAADRYEAMQYRRTGRSGLLLPVVSLGLWHNFGGDRSLETKREIIRRAFDLGITHFDLANNYGPPYGSAEENFGRILDSELRPYRDELIISTKAGYDMWPGPYGEWGSRKYLLASLDQSLAPMGLEYVDIFYSHRFDPDTPLEETLGALDSAVRQGKALYVGISNYSPAQTVEAARILRGLGT